MTNKLTEKMLIEIMRDEYKTRLVEAMNETDMFDNRGNMVIRKGLKVRHKDTQYEYTVDDVLKDETGDVVVRLKSPEEPRFKTNDIPGDEEIISGGKKDVLHEVDPPPVSPVSLQNTSDTDEEDEDVFVIDQKASEIFSFISAQLFEMRNH